jgi:hypothetical protein
MLFLLLGGYLQGRHDAPIVIKNIVNTITNKQQVVTEKVVTKYITTIEKVKGDNETIIQFVTNKNDVMCTLPKSFGVLHDSAASGTVPNAADATDGTPSGITLSDAERIIIKNYGTYNEVAEQLKSLQEWVTGQNKLNPKK